MSKVINWLSTSDIWIEASSYYWDYQLDTTLRVVTSIDTFIETVVDNVKEFFDPFSRDEEELNPDHDELGMQIDGNYKSYETIEEFEKDLRAITELTPIEIHMDTTADQPNFAVLLLQKTDTMAVWD